MNPTYFIDTSALTKLYVQEAGTGWMQQIAASCSSSQLYVSLLARVEMAPAVARRQRTGSLTNHESQQVIANFDADWNVRFTIVALDDKIIERAYDLVLTYGLRAYDAVHLSAALTLRDWFALLGERAPTFLSAGRALAASCTAGRAKRG